MNIVNINALSHSKDILFFLKNIFEKEHYFYRLENKDFLDIILSLRSNLERCLKHIKNSSLDIKKDLINFYEKSRLIFENLFFLMGNSSYKIRKNIYDNIRNIFLEIKEIYKNI